MPGSIQIITIFYSIGDKDYTIYTDTDDVEVSKQMSMDTAPVIIQDRTYIPIRFVAEALGATVSWDASNRTATIDSETIAPMLIEAPPSFDFLIN